MKIKIAFFKKFFLNKKLLSFLVIKKILVLYMIGSLLSQSAAVHAQAAPVANFVINRTIAGVLTKAIAKRGFASNDPVYAKTFAAVSTASTALNVASTFAGVALTVAGAPVWLTIAAGLGVLGLGAYLTAGSAKLELQQGNLKYSPAPLSVPSFTPTYPTFVGDIWEAQLDNFFEAYVRNNAKMFRGVACFERQACMGLPSFPVGYEPLIKQTFKSMKLSFGGDFVTYGSGEFIVVFDSLEEFTHGFALRALLVNMGSAVQPTIQGVPGVKPHYESQFVCNYCISMETSDYWTWEVLPQIFTAADGSSKIYGIYSSYRECVEYQFGVGACANDAYRWAPVTSTFISDDAYYTKELNGDSNAPFELVIRADGAPSLYPSADDLNTKLSSAQKGQKLSNETIAALADAVWRKAAEQPGYDGVPYSVSSPVSPSDVADYIAANPVPSVGDLLTLASDAGTQNVPITGSAQPGTGGSTPPPAVIAGDVNVVNTPNVNIVGKVKLDLGDGTGQSMPLLDFLPDFNLVFDPILSWASGQASRQMPPHVSECPAPIIDFFGNQIVLNAHCKLIEDNSATIGGVMWFVYSFTAFTVLFSA